ncbi:MAG: hypothetical protein U5K75_04910 [Ahrensia sp.]|nr:hypothetical protein [Ahrensia sp.]
MQTLQHAMRATLVSINQQPLEHKHLKDMGDVLVRSFFSERTTEMREHWLQYPDAMRNYTKSGQLPEYELFQDFSFQELWAKNADEVVGALLQRENDGLNYTTIMNIDFTNPFAYLLGKQAPKHIAIGADPTRIVKFLLEDQAEALADTDILLMPQCPYTNNAHQLRTVYTPALQDHTEVQVSPCYSALIHPRIQAQWK